MVLDLPLRKCEKCKAAPVEAQPAQGALDCFVPAQTQEGNAGRSAEETYTTNCEVPACHHGSYTQRHPCKTQSET